jgi:hypothetical protein
LLHDLGTPVKVQQTLLGDSSAATTTDVYTHPVSESERDAVTKLGTVLFPNVPNLHQNAEVNPKMARHAVRKKKEIDSETDENGVAVFPKLQVETVDVSIEAYCYRADC